MKCTNDDNVYGETYIEYIQYRSNENQYVDIIQRLRKMKECLTMG